MSEKLTKEQLAVKSRHLYAAACRSWNETGVPASVGKERFIPTPYGDVRVLEYGFENENAPILFDLHGGGWMFLHADADEYMNTSICKKTGVRIVAIDYPKGPDAPFPAALESSYEIMRRYAAGKPVGVMGHSAGGNMSAALCLLAHRREDFKIAYQVLDYPVLDLDMSPYDKPEPDPDSPASISELFTVGYAAEHDTTDPLISPALMSDDELSHMPPALMIVCGIDALRNEGLEYEARLKALGVETELRDFPTMKHAFTNRPFPETDEAIGYMSDFVLRHIR